MLDELTDDALTRDFRILQRAKGHRYSVDDLATAFVAWNARPSAKRLLDLGCGIGSVLLTLAWKIRDAELVGVEAQAISFELLERNVARAAVSDRVRVHHGDLREEAVIAKLGRGFDLITGTPPYFRPGAAMPSKDEQRAYARIEHRGGVEAYLATADRVVADDGVVVVCSDARAPDRVARGAKDARLFIHARCDVIPREGERALFSIWTLGRAETDVASSTMTMRDAAGARTEDARNLRRFSGLELID